MTLGSEEASYGAWLHLLDRARTDVDSLGRLTCPACGDRALRLYFVTATDKDANGYVAFWCDSCRFGIAPGLGAVPPRGKHTRRGDPAIPNYQLVVPGPRP